jgi:hypothetical protein
VVFALQGSRSLFPWRSPTGLVAARLGGPSSASLQGPTGERTRSQIRRKASSKRHRTPRQNARLHVCGCSAERHLRVRSRLESMLGVGRLGPRSEPVVGGTLNGMLVARYGAVFPLTIRPVGQVARSRSIEGAIRSSLRTSPSTVRVPWGQPKLSHCPERAESLPRCSLPTYSAAGAWL